MQRLAALILAAGFSSRLGAFKPTLEIEGRTFLERAVGAFRDVGIGDVIVVAGHRGDEVEAAAALFEASSVRNSRYEQGMYTSVQAGVAALSPSVRRFFVLPVDCALVRPETIGRLARAGEYLGADVVQPVFGGVAGHPPLVSAALRAEILTGEPPGGLRALLLSHAERSAVIDVADPGVTFDADTAADLPQALTLARAAGLPGEERCGQILGEHRARPGVVAHSRAVAAVATALTSALNECGQHLCLPLVVAAALLHDVARSEPRHAEAGAAIIEALGYPRVAAVVLRHMDLGAEPGTDVGEAEIVYLADKLVLGEQVVTLEERFAPRLRESADDSPALAAARSRREAALTVRRRVEDVLGRPLGPLAVADAPPV